MYQRHQMRQRIEISVYFVVEIKRNVLKPFMYICKRIFSSPELKVQLRFSDRLMSVVRPTVCMSVRLSVNFSHFDIFSRTNGPNFTRLGTKHLNKKGILNY